jgi:ribose transport system substrate-binding protein
MQAEDGWVPAHPVIPCSGEAENGSRVRMLPVDSGVKGAMGAPGLSLGSGLFVVPYALKVAMNVIEKKDVPHLINYAPVVVSSKNIKLCTTASAEDFANGCNTLNPSVVPDDYFTDFWSPLTPEIGIKAVQTGTPD